MAEDGSLGQPDSEKAGEQGSKPEPTQAEFDMEFVPELPEGRAVFPAERHGRFVWLVAEGAMTQQCFNEMRDYLIHIVGSGMWTQRWEGPPQRDPVT